MSSVIQDRPSHFSVENELDEAPDNETSIPGRVRITEDRVTCVASPSLNGEEGLLGRLDDETQDLLQPGQMPSGSVLNVVDDWGDLENAHNFDVETLDGDAVTQVVDLDDLAAVNVRFWNDHDLSGAENTYATEVVNHSGRSLLIQLGHGPRNRGEGKRRHAALAREIYDAAVGNGVELAEPMFLDSREEVAVQSTGGAESTSTEGAATGIENQPEASDSEEGTPDWLASSPKLVVSNEQVAPETVTVGWNTDEEEYNETVTVDQGEEVEWEDLPESGDLQVGVSLSNGGSETETVSASSVMGEKISASISQDGVSLSLPETSTQDGVNTVEQTTQQPATSGTSTQATQSATSKTDTRSVDQEPDEEQDESGKIGGGKLILLGFAINLIGPLPVVFLQLPMSIAVAIMGIGLLTILFGAIRLIRGFLG